MFLFDFIRAKHNLVFKLLIVFAGALILALLQPTIDVKGHKVDDFDAVWPYKDLIAEKEILMPKDEQTLKNELLQLKNTSPLFFYEDTVEKSKKLIKLKLEVKDQVKYKLIEKLLDSIYKKGVIESIPEEQRQKAVFITRNGFSEQAAYYDLYTIENAIEQLTEYTQNKKDPVLKKEDLLPYLSITCFFDQNRTEKYAALKAEKLSVYETVIRPGGKVVSQGEVLTIKKRRMINTYYDELNSEQRFSILKFSAGYVIFFLLFLMLLFYLAFFRKIIFGQNKEVFFLYFVIISGAIFTSVFYKFGLIITALPFCLIPILVRVFFDSRTALFTHLIAVICFSFFMPDKLEFILMQLMAGIGTLFAVSEMRKRQQLFASGIVILLIYCVVFFSYQVFTGNKLTAFKLSAYIPFVISSFMVLLAFPLIYITEKLFGFMSDFKLLELGDLNQPLLRRLSQEVPGTFQHSLQVANLAEEVIFYIGGNTLLVRTGAMYHDIGKLYNPKYFTENQSGGYSPHMEMQPQESARIIIDHVIKGIELAKKDNLPEQVIDFIRTHHGTTTTGYFWSIYKKEKTVTEKDEQEFRYPGPIPFSKETAVLMLADAVEASSRSLKHYDALSISDLVDQIIDYKISQNQLINSDITFKDITMIKKIFKKRLMNIYHVRIEYPA